MGDAQLRLGGGETPLDDLDLSPNLRLLAERERKLDSPLTPYEAGAILHAARGKHSEVTTCSWCVPDGFEALKRLRAAQGRP